MNRNSAFPARRIRVAFCIDNMNVGGTELNAVRLAERLDRNRFDLRILCLQDRGPLLARYEAAGFPVVPMPLGSLYGPRAFQRGLSLARWLRRNGIDVLHAHDIYSNVFAVPWAKLAGVRTIASRRWWEGLGGLHWKVATRVGYRLADAVLANSERVGVMLREVDAVDPGKVVVVPNFLDETAFERPAADVMDRLRLELGLEDRDRVVGIVANLHPIKDHSSLIEAVATIAGRWPSLRLVLVGDGEMRAQLERQVARLGLVRNVIFAGRRPNVPNLQHLFEISVLSSLSEGLPNSVLEAMAAGNPVVTTDVGAVRDAVIDGTTGVVVPPADPQALAGALESLLSDPDRARRLGDAGDRRARAHYSAASALAALEALYLRLGTQSKRRAFGGGEQVRPAETRMSAAVGHASGGIREVRGSSAHAAGQEATSIPEPSGFSVPGTNA